MIVGVHDAKSTGVGNGDAGMDVDSDDEPLTTQTQVLYTASEFSAFSPLLRAMKHLLLLRP